METAEYPIGAALRQPNARGLSRLALGLALAAAPAAIDAAGIDGHANQPGAAAALPQQEVVVVAGRPSHPPLASVTTLDAADVRALSAWDLSELLGYLPGAAVSAGNKAEATLRIRGTDSRRLLLLVDGVPVHEPYFGTFDLNTFSVLPVESITLRRGATSVLYGPDALAGVVELRLRRPRANRLEVQAEAGANDTWRGFLGAECARPQFGLLGAAAYTDSDGFDWRDGGMTRLRANSDREQRSYAARGAWTGLDGAVFTADFALTDAEYGVPPAVDYYQPRYWRFETWRRMRLSLEAAQTRTDGSGVRGNVYYLGHENALQSFADAAYLQPTWRSTLETDTYGGMVLAETAALRHHALRGSFHARVEQVESRPDAGAPADAFERAVLSAGLEDVYSPRDDLQLVAGAGADLLSSDSGDEHATFNPLIGVEFRPLERITLYASQTWKTRFPSMRALYGSPSGNPELTEERRAGTEAGLRLSGAVNMELAAFYDEIDDLVVATRTEEGVVRFANVGEARILGLELSAAKRFTFGEFRLGYTRLDTEDEATGRALELVPETEIDIRLRSAELGRLSATLWGTFASGSHATISGEQVEADAYFAANAQVELRLPEGALFVTVENLFDEAYVTEPGYPMPARHFSAGLRFAWGGRDDHAR